MAPLEGNIEASHLLEQIESLRGAVRFLRTENGYLKGQELLKEIQSLPALGELSSASDPPSTPPLVSDAGSDDDSSEVMGVISRKNAAHLEGRSHQNVGSQDGAPGSLRSLSTESKLLYRELLDYSASPRLIDLEALEQERKQGWMPQRKTAAHRLWERRREGDRLGKMVKGLMGRVQSAGAVNIVS